MSVWETSALHPRLGRRAALDRLEEAGSIGLPHLLEDDRQELVDLGKRLAGEDDIGRGQRDCSPRGLLRHAGEKMQVETPEGLGVLPLQPGQDPLALLRTLLRKCHAGVAEKIEEQVADVVAERRLVSLDLIAPPRGILEGELSLGVGEKAPQLFDRRPSVGGDEPVEDAADGLVNQIFVVAIAGFFEVGEDLRPRRDPPVVDPKQRAEEIHRLADATGLGEGGHQAREGLGDIQQLRVRFEVRHDPGDEPRIGGELGRKLGGAGREQLDDARVVALRNFRGRRSDLLWGAPREAHQDEALRPQREADHVAFADRRGGVPEHARRPQMPHPGGIRECLIEARLGSRPQTGERGAGTLLVWSGAARDLEQIVERLEEGLFGDPRRDQRGQLMPGGLHRLRREVGRSPRSKMGEGRKAPLQVSPGPNPCASLRVGELLGPLMRH